MNFLLVGTNHRIAHLDTRERLAGTIGEVRAWLAKAADTPAGSLAEVLVLATCHRVEIYAATDDLPAAEARIHALVSGSSAASLIDAHSPRYVLSGEDAVRHLCRVACGLDSVIVGEAEISGQLRRAAAVSREAGVLGPYLERLVGAALRSSGRARAETEIGRGVTSAASAGVALAESLLGSLAHQSVLVVGAGQAGRQVLSRLARLETGAVFVASRSERHAREAAAVAGASVVTLDRIAEQLSVVDVLFTTLQAPAPIVDAASCVGRGLRPLLAVDLSVPRAVDPAVAGVEGVTLRTVDDLGDIARESLARRVQEVPRVEAIAHDEAARAWAQTRARAARAGERAG